MKQREGFNSRLGFLLVSAGCAIGIGNVWRFPYVAGQYGGGFFVLLYLLFLLILGVPVLTMELAIGRAGKSSIVQAYRKLQKPGTRWDIHGWICMIGCCLLMMYYTTVSGWMVAYFWKFVTGQFNGLGEAAIPGVFDQLLASPGQLGFWMALVVALGFLCCSFGLQKGLERVTKWMMSALLLLIIVLVFHSMSLSGAAEGLSFYLVPNPAVIQEIGLGTIIVQAMNQAFFTLSLGIAAMEIFGSYMSRTNTLTSEAVTICGLDTFVAIMAGLIIFPACFTYGVTPDQGPSLIFITLPSVFTHMVAGQLWGALFFLFMSFASFSTVIAVFENLLAFCMDTFGWSRKKSSALCGLVIFVASLPCVLGYNIWAGLLPGGQTVLDLEDYLVSNILLPGGSLVFLLFCTTQWGWGYEAWMAEANTGKGIKLSRKLGWYVRFVLPLLILFILVQGLF